MATDKRKQFSPERADRVTIIADLNLSKRRYYHAMFFPGEPEPEVAFTLGSLLAQARAQGYRSGRIYTATTVVDFEFAED